MLHIFIETPSSSVRLCNPSRLAKRIKRCFYHDRQCLSSCDLVARSGFCIFSWNDALVSCNFNSSADPIIFYGICEVFPTYIVFRKSCSFQLQCCSDGFRSSDFVIETVSHGRWLFDYDALISEIIRIWDIGTRISATEKGYQGDKREDFFHRNG